MINEHKSPPPSLQAFTLIEISIVLVILALLLGGIVSGKSLIESARLRSQLEQIDLFKTATNSFRDKYLHLPGDLPNGLSFGFYKRNQLCPGFGNGDGLIHGPNNVNQPCTTTYGGAYTSSGEPIIFWQDLSMSGMIPYGFKPLANTYNAFGLNYALKEGLK